MHVVIFEGSHWTRLAPLSLSRPVFMLMSGAGTLLDKQIRCLKPTRLTLWVRPEMVGYCKRFVVPALKVPTSINTPLNDEPALVTSGRTLHFTNFEYPQGPAVVIDEGDVVRSAFVRMAGLSPDDVMNRTPRWLEVLKLPQTMPQSRLVDYPWDLLSWNEESLLEDSVSMPIACTIHPPGPWHLIDDQNIMLADAVKLAPGVVLDGSSGPIIIGTGAKIGANSVIQGPAYIGEHTLVLPLTLIRPGTSIGPYCRIGGEISNSIIQGNSNKSHYGFVGDSYIGEWVNLGAGTSTSNLKNTYDSVQINIAGKNYNTGRKFVGSLIGDHCKTAIGTRLMTGSYIGYATQIAKSTITPSFVPSFTWMSDKGTTPYRMDKVEQVARAVYARRNHAWENADTEFLSVIQSLAAKVETE